MRRSLGNGWFLSAVLFFFMIVLTMSLNSCGGGGGGTVLLPAAKSKLVSFVTSTRDQANLSAWPDAIAAGNATGLNAADAVCQARAVAAGLRGNFRAWLSDDNNDAYCRVHGLNGKKSANCGRTSLPDWAGPWVRTDGEPFAEVISKLTGSGVVLTPAILDENGAPSNRYWTGTDEAGVALADNCTGWSETASLSVTFGEPAITNSTWTNGGNTNCSWQGALLCMQTGRGAPLTYQTSGKKVFKTSTFGNGKLALWSGASGTTGIAAGDAVCNARAAAAGLTGTYKAWLSDSSTDASARITSSGPWIRLDGIKLAKDKADLTDGTLETTITVDEFGAYNTSAAWTGSTNTGLKDTDTCTDWTDDTSGVKGVISYSSIYYLWSGWTGNPQPCNQAFNALYCFED